MRVVPSFSYRLNHVVKAIRHTPIFPSNGASFFIARYDGAALVFLVLPPLPSLRFLLWLALSHPIVFRVTDYALARFHDLSNLVFHIFVVLRQNPALGGVWFDLNTRGLVVEKSTLSTIPEPAHFPATAKHRGACSVFDLCQEL